MTAITTKLPVRRSLECSDAEWAMRVDLAACYRLVDAHGWIDQIYNHITARVPGEPKHFLINPYGLAYSEVCASNLVKIDLDGNVVDGSSYGINAAGYTIHSAVHAVRHDAVCVLHTHSDASTAVSCLEEGFMPMTQGGFQFYNRLAYHDYEGIALDLSERERLVADLGDKWAMVLYNHGILTLGETVSHAFSRLYYFEQACRVQLDVLATGRPIKMPSPEVCEHTAKQWEPKGRDWEPEADKTTQSDTPEWAAYLRMLDRKDPSFRD